jgi:hypothetical protein
MHVDPSGNRYEGEWNKGIRHGKGMTTLVEGTILIGDYF